MAIWHEEYELYRKYIHNISRFYKQSEHIRAYLELGLSLGAVVIFLAFAIRPTIVTISEKLREMEDKQVVLDKLNTKVDSLSKADSLMRQERETLALLEEAIPAGAMPEDYVIQVDALAQRTSIAIEAMSVEEAAVLGSSITVESEGENTVPSNKAGRIEWFPFSISSTGTFEEVSAYINNLETLRRPIKLVTTLIEETESGELRFTLKGEVPYHSNE